MEPIKIISVTWPIDNSGGEETATHPSIILECLKIQDSDDDLFTDSEGRTYCIDDLIGKEVEVDGVFLTP
jgi:hypothetical protein